MQTFLITAKQLNHFKQELIEEIKLLVKETRKSRESHWIRSAQVREILQISSSSLQKLRNNGSIPFTKVDGLIFYNRNHIEQLLLNNINKTDENSDGDG
ncbi:helix-turn-helix domain-containing protein [Galbibacter sp. EGI 63066]|uniref:helix-turn-helix domain-containing protein n=1 Tax=Galbibacter sp. EGI 63066 TaxID=2993559 RepID=UPI0022494723|nr:helix-turn-helix domain-containing protein [Galbibacter sp. EGI 63066]MCX2680662.1 helix-turn-helix domain-containing protein [Galbibacter sp. EGI 63066]